MKRALSILCAALLLTMMLPLSALAAEGDVTGLELRTTSLTLEADGNATVTVDVEPTDATADIQWVSSDTSVAKVTPVTGVANRQATVTAVAPGETTIYVESGDVRSVSCTVEVSGVILNETATTLVIGEKFTLTPETYGNAKLKTWAYSSDNSRIAYVDRDTGRVTAYSEGTCVITCQSSDGLYSKTCAVTVVPDTSSTVWANLTSGQLALSNVLSAIQTQCEAKTEKALLYLTNLRVSTSYGALYYNYRSESDTGEGVASNARYYVDGGNGLQFSNILFIPRSDFSGEAIISYTASNGTDSYNGEIAVTVEHETISGISYTSLEGAVIHFDSEDFNSECLRVQNYALSFVTFNLPSASRGQLYYNYDGAANVESGVTSDMRFYTDQSPYIDKLTFVPAANYIGTFTLSYRGYDSVGNYFHGSVQITVSQPRVDGDGVSSVSGTTIYYDANAGERLYFNAYDFSDTCYNATGEQLDYVRFTLPSSSRGTLYYNSSTRVTSTTNYYRAGSTNRLLDNVSFIPASSYDSTLSISFTGYNIYGTSYSGTVRITVGYSSGSGSGSSDVSGNLIYYEVQSGSRLYFDVYDFIDVCYNETDYQLSYVRFTLPASSRGTLYYNSSTRVTETTNYYRTGSSQRLISDVNFVPASGYTGTVNISFTGHNNQGDTFYGTIRIVVTSGGNSGSGSSVSIGTGTTVTMPQTITYSTTGEAVVFRASDFVSASVGVLSGTVDHIQLAAPDPSIGRLYLDYTSPTDNSAFHEAENYNLSNISRIAFLPKAGYSGAAYLSYTVWDTLGSSRGASIRIDVNPDNAPVYFSDMTDYDWALPSVDFLYLYHVVNGTTATTFSPERTLSRGTYILMLSRAFNFRSAGTSSFPDVPENSHYAAAIASAKSLGFVFGDSEGNFHPDDPVTRQEAAVFLYRCLQSKNGGALEAGTDSDLRGFSDAGAVSESAVEAFGALIRLGVFQGGSDGLLHPDDTLTRAQMAVILHRGLTI